MRCYILTLLLTLSWAGTGFGQPFRAVLISAKKNSILPEGEILGKKETPDCPTPWSVRIKTLHGGKQEGVQLLTLDNGKLRIVIIPTRGMGIMDVTMGDLKLGWKSPVQEVVHPRHINLSLRGGVGWLEGFNEWCCRCGLENVGQAGPDEIISNVGDKTMIDLTLHGKIANIPASEVDVLVQDRPPYRILVRGILHEKMIFGPKFELTTELSTEPGSNTFRIQDTIVNKGSRPQEYQILYHCNFGKPLLGEGAKLYVPIRSVAPYNANAARDVKNYNTFTGPQSGFIEQVYLLRPLADDDGKVQALLRNPQGNRAVLLKYALKELPYLSVWKHTGAEEDGYVVGLEPGVSFPNPRRIERQAKRVPVLQGGASQTMRMDFTLLDSKYWIDQTISQINQLQRGEVPLIEALPAKREKS